MSISYPITDYFKNAGRHRGIAIIPDDQRIDIPMESQCRISIVIPAYNEEENIIGALESAMSQKKNGVLILPQFFEVVIVDNNSSDSTTSRISDWVQSNNASNVFLVNEETEGVTAARKRGFDEVVLRFDERNLDHKHYILSADADNVLNEHWISDYLDTFEKTSADMLCGQRNFDLKALEKCENVKAFLAIKSSIENRIKAIYTGRAEGLNFGVTLDSYVGVGGFTSYVNYEDDDFYPSASDDWIFSAELMNHGYVVGTCGADVKINPRKLISGMKKFLDGDLYEKNWEEASALKEETRDISKDELALLVKRQVRGIIAYQLLMSVYSAPELLRHEASTEFLGTDLTDQLEKEIRLAHEIYPRTYYDEAINYYYPAWFLYFKLGEEIQNKLKKQFPEIVEKFSLPRSLSAGLKNVTEDFKMNQQIYAYCAGSDNYAYLNKYFGSWF